MNKRKVNLFLLLILVVYTGCTNKKLLHNEENFNSNFDVGVIKTTGQKNKSFITYYDTQLKEVSKQGLPYASLGNIFYNPVVFKQKLYIIPQGLANAKDKKTVFELNLNTGKKKEYHIDQLAMNSIAVNEEYIFTCNTLDGTSYINRCDKKDEKVEKVLFQDTYISKLVLHNDILYAFSSRKGENFVESYLYKLDLSLNILDKKDISNYGNSNYKTAIINDMLYFSNQVDKEDNPNHIIGIYSENSDRMSRLDMKEYYPSDILSYKELLVIAHCDMVRGEGNTITLYNIDTNASKVIKLNHNILQMDMVKDKLYIIDAEYLYQYKMEKDYIKLNNKVKIQYNDNSDVYYYVSGFFTK